MGFIDSSPSPTRLPLRPLPDEPSLILRSRTATFQTRSVLAVPPGSDGLLRSETRSEDLASWQLAGLLHPAADRGVRPVSDFLGSEDLPVHHPGGARLQKPSSQARTLRSVLLPGSSLPSPRSPAFTGKRCPLAVGPNRTCRHAQSEPRPRGLAPPRSPFLEPRRFRHVRVDAPMGFGSTRSCLPRISRGRVRYPPVRAAHLLDPPRVPEAREPGEAKCSRLCLAPRTDVAVFARRQRRQPAKLRSQPEDCRACPAASTFRCRMAMAR
jgi:hypothetical protein